jgi:hypothetical protein
MASITTLRNRLDAIEATIGTRQTRVLIFGGLPEGSQSPSPPPAEPMNHNSQPDAAQPQPVQPGSKPVTDVE